MNTTSSLKAVTEYRTAEKRDRDHTLAPVVRYVLYDIFRNRVLPAYGLFLLAASLGMFTLGGDPTKALAGLLNISLIISPLVALAFSTIYYYNAYEFIELMAAQPVRRSTVLWSLFIGLGTALSAAVALGIGLPVLLFAANPTGFTLFGVSVALNLVFTALGLLISVIGRDKAKGLGWALLAWFFFSLLYDAFVLLFMFSFADYPLEKALLLLTALNPVDLARTAVLLQMDISALMGVTGALFREWLGTDWGLFAASAMGLVWIAVPYYLALKIFEKKDL